MPKKKKKTTTIRKTVVSKQGVNNGRNLKTKKKRKRPVSDESEGRSTTAKARRKRKRRKKSVARMEARRKKFKGLNEKELNGNDVKKDKASVTKENEEDESFISIFDDEEEEDKKENVVLSPTWNDRGTPWNTSIDRSIPPILRLHNDIIQFTKFISPTSSEASGRNLIERRIREVTSRLFPGSKLCVFGSTVTNLCLPGSDVDMCVFFSKENTNLSTAFDLLSETLRQLGGIADMEEIKNARVPIIKFKDIMTGLNVDICFDQSSGLRTAAYVKEALREYPCARPLILVIKYYLSQRNLNETYQGGFGSFLVTLLVIGYLQYRVRKYGEDLNRDIDLGTHLMGLLQLYGKDMNAAAVTLVLRDGGSFQRKRHDFVVVRRPSLFSVENPDETQSDVGKNSWDISKVRQSLAHAFHVMRGVLMNSGDDIGLGLMIVSDALLKERESAAKEN